MGVLQPTISFLPSLSLSHYFLSRVYNCTDSNRSRSKSNLRQCLIALMLGRIQPVALVAQPPINSDSYATLIVQDFLAGNIQHSVRVKVRNFSCVMSLVEGAFWTS